MAAIFNDCLFLKFTNVTLPDSITAIGSSAFIFCSSLESITIPSGITIDQNAFRNSGIKNLVIHENVEITGQYAFAYCTSLQSVVIGDGVTINEDNVFSCNTSLTSVTFEGNVTLGTNVFSTFYNCTQLTNITLPEGFNIIGNTTFGNCSALTEITLPATVTSIGYCAFENCTNLTTIKFNGTADQWNNIEKNDDWAKNAGSYTVYDKDGNTITS